MVQKAGWTISGGPRYGDVPALRHAVPAGPEGCPTGPYGIVPPYVATSMVPASMVEVFLAGLDGKIHDLRIHVTGWQVFHGGLFRAVAFVGVRMGFDCLMLLRTKNPERALTSSYSSGEPQLKIMNLLPKMTRIYIGFMLSLTQHDQFRIAFISAFHIFPLRPFIHPLTPPILHDFTFGVICQGEDLSPTCLHPKKQATQTKFGTKPNSYTHFNNKSVIVNQLPQCQKYEIQLEIQATDLCWGGRVGRKEGPKWNLHLWHSETLQNIPEEIRPLLASWKMVYWNYLLHRLSLKKKWSLCGTSTNWIFIGYLLEDICSWSFIQGDSGRKLSKFPGQQSKDVHPTRKGCQKKFVPKRFLLKFLKQLSHPEFQSKFGSIELTILEYRIHIRIR